jgi:hypothetical protein
MSLQRETDTDTSNEICRALHLACRRCILLWYNGFSSHPYSSLIDISREERVTMALQKNADSEQAANVLCEHALPQERSTIACPSAYPVLFSYELATCLSCH